MGFLDQLRQQAQAVRAEQGQAQQQLQAAIDATEAACRTLQRYLADLAAQLNVLQPASRPLSLDGKTPWPAMKLCEFRFDARKKILRQQELTDHVALGWRILPQSPLPATAREGGRVAVNFPPELQRVEARLAAAHVPHERLEQRHPETRKLQAIVFAHAWEGRGSVVFHAEHEQGELRYRFNALAGLVVQQGRVRAQEVSTAWLDDVARALVGEPSPWG